MSWTNESAEVCELSEALAKHLVGRSVRVQGAALADLLAIWLAGHVNRDDPDHSDAIREDMLELHLETVRALIPLNYETRVKPLLKRKMQ